MSKNQLQELAQRSCFNLPSYVCVREGPDHAPRFRASVNFNGEIFQGPSNCTTLRQAEHAAAEIALTNLSSIAPSRSLASRVLDETGVYKNLLQETAHRAGLKLPVYTTVRSGPGHQPVFTSTVELAKMCFAGSPAKTKKQAEKNAAMAAWSALRKMPDLDPLSWPKDVSSSGGEEHDQVVRVLSNFKSTEENKQARQREHHHPQPQKQRRKALLGEGPSSYSLPRFQQQWRSHEPMVNVSLMITSQQKPKKSSLQPPLLSPVTKVPSRFLFPSNSGASSRGPSSSKDECITSRPISELLGNSSSQSPSPDIQLEGKNGKRVHESAMVQAKASTFSAPAYSKHFTSLPFSPPLKIHTAEESVTNSSSIPVPRTMSTAEHQSTGIAPAVQMRSVIPVCAAPPPRPPPSALADDRPDVIPEKETDLLVATSQFSSLRL